MTQNSFTSKGHPLTNRQLKRRVLALLQHNNLQTGIQAITSFPARRVVNPLLATLYSTDPIQKWRAITAMGAVVAQLANQDMESARVIMRRLIWNLNDESGGIGWGSPEAMGEITACHTKLAHEYHHILISYIDENGNYLEHPVLQRGALWGVGRLAHAHVELAQAAACSLKPFLRSPDPIHRGLAAWAAIPLRDKRLNKALHSRLSETAIVQIWHNGRFHENTIGELARQALSQH